MTASSRQAGLALIELLVALVLLGLLGGLLHDGFGLGLRVWERAAARGGERLEAVEGAQAFLRDRLARAYPAWEPSDRQVAFEGGPGAIAFRTAAPDLLGPGTRQRMLLLLRPGGELAVAFVPDTDRSRLTEPRRDVLLAGVAALRLEYFGATDEDRTERWRDAWRAEPRLPRLVRVRVAFPPGDPRVWPDLVVEPRVAADARCLWDSTTGGCRGRT